LSAKATLRLGGLHWLKPRFTQNPQRYPFKLSRCAADAAAWSRGSVLAGIAFGAHEVTVTHLRKMMLDELQRRNYAPGTIRSYIHTVEDFAGTSAAHPTGLGRTNPAVAGVSVSRPQASGQSIWSGVHTAV
jgi:hypothetical protein